MLKLAPFARQHSRLFFIAKQCMRVVTGAVIGIFLVFPAVAKACPDLSPYFLDSEPDWAERERQLAELMPECLDNSQYFALIGSAQLNLGQLAPALESLERALLQDPQNGAAQIDYAETLYEIGQLFGALELNRQLLRRDDLPAGLQPLLEQRQLRWQALTRQTSLEADLRAGYDNNLNGGPDSSQITLTPSGEPILLSLSPELQPISGPYLNMGLSGRLRQLAADHQHNWSTALRGRVSEDTDSDLLQFATQYAYIKPAQEHSWQFVAGMNHLLYGGSALFTGAEASARYQLGGSGTCKPYYELAVQQQYYHGQHVLNALESKLGAGLNCNSVQAARGYQLTAEISALNNKALRSGRLGGNRAGWQVGLDWRYPLSRGTLRAQLNYTELQDRDSYSPLLASGADRWQNRGSVSLQYAEPINLFGRDSTLLINLFSQRQKSNIQLFRTADTSAEIGFSWAF